jgi:hypothetical protein
MRTPLPLIFMSSLALALPGLAQQSIDGTNTGAPTQGPGSPALTAPVTKPGPNQVSVTLTAIDSKTISSLSNTNWNDNRFRAYWSNASQGYVDGLVKFDLSSIPDTANITSMTLRAYHEYGYGNPLSDPEVVIYRSDGDTWARSNASDPHPGIQQTLTTVYTGFPSADLVPVDFVIDVNAANWSIDLADDTLTLVSRNVAGAVSRYSYVYFYGSDGSPAPPELIIEHDGGGPQLALVNLVAGGTTTAQITGAEAFASCYLGWSKTGAGPTSINTPWGTFTADLSAPIRRVGPFPADAGGNAAVTAFVPVSAQGLTIYVHALTTKTGGAELTNSVAEVVQ